MKIILILMICLGSAFFGQVMVGDVPVVNWSLGAMAGVVSTTMWAMK